MEKKNRKRNIEKDRWKSKKRKDEKNPDTAKI